MDAGEPGEAAAAAVTFMSGDHASYLTGQTSTLSGFQSTLDVLVLLFASSDGDVPVLSSRNPPDWWCQSLA